MGMRIFTAFRLKLVPDSSLSAACLAETAHWRKPAANADQIPGLSHQKPMSAAPVSEKEKKEGVVLLCCVQPRSDLVVTALK
jgi:hypothetical protein